jgi:hypothetical protein
MAEPVSVPAVPEQAPAPVVQMQPAPVIEQEQPVMQPMIAQPVTPSSAPLPQMPNDSVKEAPQVAEAEEAAPVEEAKPAAGALPSPQILRDVKMLPPSRYSVRTHTSGTQAQ